MTSSIIFTLHTSYILSINLLHIYSSIIAIIFQCRKLAFATVEQGYS